MLKHILRERPLLALLALTTAVIAFSSASAFGASAVTVKVRDDLYTPKSVKVARGTKVVWKWAGVLRHNVKVKSGPSKFHSKTQEDADAVGLSILSGAHMTLVPRIMELLAEQGVDDVVVTVGGTIPADDVEELKGLGVAEVFTPGAPTQQAIDFIRGAVRA